MKIDGLTPTDYQRLMSPLRMGEKDKDYWEDHEVTVSRVVDEALRVAIGSVSMVFLRLLNLAFGTHKWETDKSLVHHLSKGFKSADQLKDKGVVTATAKIAYSLFARIGEGNTELNELIESLPRGAAAQGQKAQEKRLSSLFENEFEQVIKVLKDKDYPPETLLEAFERAALQEPLPSTAPNQFPNIDNSCYMDASLQMLLATTSYFEDLFKQPISEEDPDKANKEKLRDLFLKLSEERTTELSKQFRKALAESGYMWALQERIGGQQDAEEFLTAAFAFCSGNLKEDQHTLLTTAIKTAIPDADDANAIRWAQSDGKNEQHNLLRLGLEGNGRKSLQDLIKKYMYEQHDDEENPLKIEDSSLPGGEACFPKWEEKITFRNAPEYLLVQLKRFTSEYDMRTSLIRTTKNKAEVYLPENGKIDLSPFIDPSVTPDGRSYEYKLAGKIMHSGRTQNNGHYTADVKGRDGNWYHCDDMKSKVKKIEEPRLEEAYIILLRRE